MRLNGEYPLEYKFVDCNNPRATVCVECLSSFFGTGAILVLN
jgi:hypothetical protein